MKAKSAVCSPCGSRSKIGAVPSRYSDRLVVGVDGDQPGLGVGGALVEGEVGGGAVGDRVGVAEEALGGVEDHVLGGLGAAGVVEGEGGREVGVAAGLGVEVVVAEGFDRLGGLRRGGEQPPPQQAARRRRARRAGRGGTAALSICGLIVSVSSIGAALAAMAVCSCGGAF